MIDFTSTTLPKGIRITAYGLDAEIVAYIIQLTSMFGDAKIVYEDCLPEHYKKSKTAWYIRYGFLEEVNGPARQYIHFYFKTEKDSLMAVLAQ